MLFASTKANPRITYKMRVKGKSMDGELNLKDFIDVKGWKALGNKFSDAKLTSVKEILLPESGKLKAGDSIDFDIKGKGQKNLFEE